MRLPTPIADVKKSLEEIEKTVKVPESTLHQDLLSLYNRGQRGDVTFVVDGVRIPAHEAILCARSKVFDRELSCGMRESSCREIRIDDVDVSTFKVFLKFLYTDDLASVEEEVKAMTGDEAAGKA